MTTNHPVVPFCFDEMQIRTQLDDEGHPLFVATDVAAALGYKRPNDAIKQHCHGAVKYRTVLDVRQRKQKVRVIYEPDLYRLIVGSQLPSAAKFEAWIFEEVLPQIRTNGSYQHPQTEPPKTSNIPTALDHIDPLLLTMLAAAPPKGLYVLYPLLAMVNSGKPFEYTFKYTES